MSVYYGTHHTAASLYTIHLNEDDTENVDEPNGTGYSSSLLNKKIKRGKRQRERIQKNGKVFLLHRMPHYCEWCVWMHSMFSVRIHTLNTTHTKDITLIHARIYFQCIRAGVLFSEAYQHTVPTVVYFLRYCECVCRTVKRCIDQILLWILESFLQASRFVL